MCRDAPRYKGQSDSEDMKQIAVNFIEWKQGELLGDHYCWEGMLQNLLYTFVAGWWRSVPRWTWAPASFLDGYSVMIKWNSQAAQKKREGSPPCLRDSIWGHDGVIHQAPDRNFFLLKKMQSRWCKIQGWCWCMPRTLVPPLFFWHMLVSMWSISYFFSSVFLIW